MKKDYPFDKPVIILAAPRSGSTLLFELLSKAKNVWTIGDESHSIFETIPKYNPKKGLCNSNRLEAIDADEENINIIRQRFYSMLRNREGIIYNNDPNKPRFLEKTPKNVLRIPFLNKVFPDAYYIFLYRNPRENISSMMDAWKSQRYVTYRNLKGRNDSWSLLLPPRWEKMNNKSLEDIAYFQWKSTIVTVIDDLQSLIPKERWKTVSYSSITNNTEVTIKELCDFAGLEFDSVLLETCQNKLEESRYTLSTPSPTKWHKHAKELNRVIPSAKHTLKKLRQIASKPLSVDFDTNIPEHLCKQPNTTATTSNIATTKKIMRNSPCPCGSGLKYKKCHGKS